ncbi:MAG: hypothetical protein E6J90_04240 [Deltaproteobacteria bacterium]|nr:MAG: hypothetical protein E6J90_04240 [Deltaproteobacteria bacterium]
MARGTIKIRYKIRVTRRIRVQTRVRYDVRVLTTVRHLVSQARARGGVDDEEVQEQIVTAARAALPASTDDDEIRDAIDAVCHEVDEDE